MIQNSYAPERHQFNRRSSHATENGPKPQLAQKPQASHRLARRQGHTPVVDGSNTALLQSINRHVKFDDAPAASSDAGEGVVGAAEADSLQRRKQV